jgi:signal transduction histidine kinase
MSGGPIHCGTVAGLSSSEAAAASGGKVASDASEILIVEPDSLVRDALVTLFSGQYRLICVDSPSAAVSAVRRGLFDAVISEVQLPGMSLSQFWQHLRTVDPDLRVLLYTAIAPGTNWISNGCSGFGEFLRKPADSTVIRAAVARTIEATRSARQMVAQTDALQRLELELEAANLERNLFAGILHDINGPLTVISSLAELLTYEKPTGSRMDSADRGDWEQTVQDLISQANLCIDISRLSLRYARNRAVSEQCDIALLFADLSRLLHFHPASRGHQLIVHPFFLPVCAQADTTNVFRILLNLALNALQSCRIPHRVEIYAWMLHERLPAPPAAGKDPASVWLRDAFENRPPFVAICVRDGGPGIPLESVPNLFDFGYSTKPEGQGTGLGLGIVRHCIQTAGGALQMETKQGEGTSFTVYLPASVKAE